MSLLDHFEELRRRIIIIVVAIAIAGIAGWLLGEPIVKLLQEPLPRKGAELIQTSIGEAFGVRFQIALIVGIALAMPVILFELWAFISPGLTNGERRLAYPLLGAALILFAAGVLLGYVLMPVVINFLLDFSLEGVAPLLGVSDYVAFVTTFLLGFGLALQFPVVMYLLARLHILSYRFLAARRRQIFVGIAIAAVILTPGDIAASSLVLTLVMYALFEITLQLIRLLDR